MSYAPDMAISDISNARYLQCDIQIIEEIATDPSLMGAGVPPDDRLISYTVERE